MKTLAIALTCLFSTAAATQSLGQLPSGFPVFSDAEAAHLNALYYDAQAHSFGSASRIDLADQATVRLSGTMYYVADYDLAHQILTAMHRPVPPEMLGLLRAMDGLESAGPVEFVREGAADADILLAMTPDDLLASLTASADRANKAHPDQPQAEVRGWVIPPRYDPEKHQLIWAALIVPKDSLQSSGGTVEYNAIAFGREGYIKVTITSSMEKAKSIDALLTTFLGGLSFQPGKGLDTADKVTPVENLTAKAMHMDTIQRGPRQMPVVFADKWVPWVGAGIAVIAGSSLGLYAFRHRRREARRW
jgi:uncharacterized membrane-anchored protein